MRARIQIFILIWCKSAIQKRASDANRNATPNADHSRWVKPQGLQSSQRANARASKSFGAAGVYPYHCHVSPIENYIYRGLYDALIHLTIECYSLALLSYARPAMPGTGRRKGIFSRNLSTQKR